MYKLIITKKSTRGVSAVSVMIAVAVVGILLAVAVPAQMRSREINHARTCQENLARIQGAIDAHSLEHKRASGQIVALGDLVKPGATGYLDQIPHCPAGGSYTISPAAVPSCSIQDNQAAPYAPHIITEAIPLP